MTEEKQTLPLFSHVEPVLAVQDITATIKYWQNTLGFPSKWTWGNPPNHGGVSWQKVFIQFTLAPELAIASKGNSIWIRVQHIETLYEFHQRKEADIVAPLKSQPWGMSEYTVRDNNGYYLHFSSPAEARQKSDEHLPDNVKIIGRKPTIQEFQQLTIPPDGSPTEADTMTKMRLDETVFAVVAVDSLTNETIGCALVLGDNVSYYYIKDVIVHPSWRNKRIGTAMMEEINLWLEKNAPSKSLVALICRETLEPFYQQFGFFPAFSMIKYMLKDDE